MCVMNLTEIFSECTALADVLAWYAWVVLWWNLPRQFRLKFIESFLLRELRAFMCVMNLTEVFSECTALADVLAWYAWVEIRQVDSGWNFVQGNCVQSCASWTKMRYSLSARVQVHSRDTPGSKFWNSVRFSLRELQAVMCVVNSGEISSKSIQAKTRWHFR